MKAQRYKQRISQVSHGGGGCDGDRFRSCWVCVHDGARIGGQDGIR